MHRAQWIPLVLLLAVIGAFYVLTLRQGHRWGDDFAMYILHARNIAEGRAYSAKVSNDALPPAAVVLMVSVRSLANLSR